ncbi:MAG: carbohydrate ABC transporter permease [Clostridiales bacterium]|nr:carbohydrate ABC transporter permease [Clostridiales bacterium]
MKAFEKNMKSRKNAIKSGNTVIMSVFFVVFCLYAITLLFPFVWIFYNSFKEKTFFGASPMSLPWGARADGSLEVPHLENYLRVFTALGEYNITIGEMFFNSITLVIGQTAASLFVCACTAYVVSKYKFTGRNIIYFLAILIMFIPTTGSLVTYFSLIQDLRLYDTYYGMIITHAGGFGMQFLILYGFFKSISWSYAEAAFIDGAGNFTVFFRIMLPMARSSLTALAVLGVIGVWNDYIGQRLYYPSYPTVAVGLQVISASVVKHGSDYPLFFCVIMICTLPILVLYASCQRIIVKNTMAGGLKG